MVHGNSFHPSCNFCHLLVAFENILNTDQGRHFVRPDLVPKCFDVLVVYPVFGAFSWGGGGGGGGG